MQAGRSEAASSERFLTEFHDGRPGVTSAAFADLVACIGTQAAGSTYDLLLDACEPVSGGIARLLDLACGDGHLLERARMRWGDDTSLHGVDFSRGELTAACARLGSAALLVRSRAQALPFADAAFDVVTSHMALMLFESIETVMAELQRVLRPGGVLALVVSSDRTDDGAGGQAIRDLVLSSPRDAPFAQMRFGDRRVRTLRGLTELLSTGFDIEAIEDVDVVRELSPAALWQWFAGMYDLDLRSPAEREAAHRGFVERWQDRTEPFDHVLHLRRIRAVARKA